MSMLEINDLVVSVNGKTILKGISLAAEEGEVAAIMGPNGSGKSTLAYTLMGHPRYKVESGSIRFKGKDIATVSTTERAKAGLFLSFQYPVEIPGVTVEGFLRSAYSSVKNKKVGVMDFHKLLMSKIDDLKMPSAFTSRHLNEGFSGGEKKKMEILQMSILEPSMAILDETDSGLDIDSLRIVAEGINKLLNPRLGILLITHYQRILNYVKPDKTHVLMDGRVVVSGGSELAQEIEKRGYDWLKSKI